nr:hypothetical protein Q903MT_gene1456 [Picea sitchensis]
MDGSGTTPDPPYWLGWPYPLGWMDGTKPNNCVLIRSLQTPSPNRQAGRTDEEQREVGIMRLRKRPSLSRHSWSRAYIDALSPLPIFFSEWNLPYWKSISIKGITVIAYGK